MKLSLENRTQSITSACLRTGRLVPSSTPPVARRGARAPALLRRPRSPSSNPSIVAAALLLPALPSSPERSSHPAVKSHRFVSNVQGTERSRVRQCACSSSFERGSRILLVRSQATPKHRSRTPGTAQGLEKQHPCAPLLIYSPIFTAALQTLAANVFQLAKADARMCGANARRFCPTFHSRIFKHRVCAHLLRLPTFLCVGEVFLPLPSQKPGVPTAAPVVQEGSRLVAGPGAGARPPDCDALIARRRFSTSSSPSWRTTSRSAG